MDSMNSKTTIIGLVAAIAVLSGAMGLSVTGAFSDLKTADTPFVTTGMLIGHLEIEAHHADGELFAYRQVDNAVVDDGEQCILKMLFATSEGTTGRGNYASSTNAYAGCSGALTGAWNVIAIGTDATTPVDTDVVLGTEINMAGAPRAIALTKVWVNGSSTAAEDAAPVGMTQALTSVTLSNTFTAGADFGAVAESGLFNSTTFNTNGMLARNTFPAVTINNGDSITITWTFNVGD